jgi:pimeloyl-ACP methyl ester carboxylesterase
MIKKISFRNKQREKLFGLLDSTNSDSLVYILPGAGEQKNQRFYQRLSILFRKKGIDSLRLDLSSQGESEGSPYLNTLTKQLNDVLVVHSKMKNRYLHFYVVGFSFGALVGLLASTKVMFQKQFLLSTALLYENRPGPLPGYFKAWKKLGTFPDMKVFQEGIIRESKQKLSFNFVVDLKRYSCEKVLSRVKCETILICGGREALIKQQQDQMFDKLKVKKKKHVIRSTGHNSGDLVYQKSAIKFIENYI